MFIKQTMLKVADVITGGALSHMRKPTLNFLIISRKPNKRLSNYYKRTTTGMKLVNYFVFNVVIYSKPTFVSNYLLWLLSPLFGCYMF